MPWSPEQRRAIAAAYKRRGKAIPKHVRDELRGKPQKRRKKKASSARDRLAERMSKRKRRKRR